MVRQVHNKVTIYTKDECAYCVRAKELLEEHKVEYEELKIGTDVTKYQLLQKVPHAQTVPQIFFGEKYIGGYEQLREWLYYKWKLNL